MQFVLTPSQLQLVAGIRNGSVPLLPDPFHGWFSDEIKSSLVRAMSNLVEEQLALYQGDQILIHNQLLPLIDTAIRCHHVLFLQVSSNVESTTYYGFYRGQNSQIGTLISQIGINAYAIEAKDVNVVIGDIVRIVNISNSVNTIAVSPFQVSLQNTERLLQRNPEASHPVRAYDFTVLCGGRRESHRVMYMRKQWWYCSPHGDEYRFDSMDVRSFVSMLEQLVAVGMQTIV